ncbi:hypothetical protein B0H19DRAFT_900443, partial [Mycena capillaripes]
MKAGDLKLTLRGLHSLLKVDTSNESITLHHASFGDFLRDPARSGAFHVGDQ